MNISIAGGWLEKDTDLKTCLLNVAWMYILLDTNTLCSIIILVESTTSLQGQLAMKIRWYCMCACLFVSVSVSVSVSVCAYLSILLAFSQYGGSDPESTLDWVDSGAHDGFLKCTATADSLILSFVSNESQEVLRQVVINK